MSGSFCYGLKARFYGLFIQLPWSFFVTVCVLVPVAYTAEPPTRALLIQLTIYWTLFVACVWSAKDIFAQRYLFEFKVSDQFMRIYNKGQVVSTYHLDQIRSVRPFSKGSVVLRFTLGGNGLLIKFDDGRELPVLDQITDYEKFNHILQKSAIAV